MKSHWITGGNGARIHLVETGNANGLPMALTTRCTALAKAAAMDQPMGLPRTMSITASGSGGTTLARQATW